MENFKIDEKLAQNVLNYLITKPYQEVFKLVGELTKLEKIEAEETVPENNTD